MSINSSEMKVVLTKSPSYLSSLLNSEEDIILIHKVEDPVNENESCYIPTPTKKNNEDVNYLDITGSPLKVDLNNSSFLSIESVNNCLNLWQKNEERYYPFSYDTAQKYIQEYLYDNYKNEKEVYTWWVLDGSDQDKTILHSILQMPTYISRSVVKLQGYLPKTHPSIEFEAMCNKHFEIINDIAEEKQKVPLRQLTCSITSTYNLCGSKISGVNFDDKCDIQGSVYVDISWNQCSAKIPLYHSKSIMTIQTIVGQQNSILFRFWNELILLELYVKSLNEYNSETMLNNHWLPNNGIKSEDSNIIDRVIETVHNCQDVPRYNNNEDGLELDKIIENVDKRHTRDITDQLWVILNRCTTYGALAECLNIVFTEIINSDNGVYTADSNMTSMAQIIKDIVAGKTSVFMLTGTQPIEILIDIGLEKLRKDFTHIFTQFGIATEEELRELFNIPSRQSVQNMSNKQDFKHIRSALYHKQSLLDMDYMDSRMKILGQLHTVLETLILVPSFWQTLSSKTVYDHYVGKESLIDSFSNLARNKLYKINVDLPATKVYEYIKNLTPSLWRMSLTLSKPSFIVKNVFHLSQHPIFPPILYNPDIMHETIGDDSITYYHYTLLTQMTNFVKTKLK